MMLMPGFFVAMEIGNILTGLRLREARAVLRGGATFGSLDALAMSKCLPARTLRQPNDTHSRHGIM
jgi:hypothetical protein